MKLTKEQNDQIFKDFENELSITDIIDKYKISRATAYRLNKKYNENNSILSKSKEIISKEVSNNTEWNEDDNENNDNDDTNIDNSVSDNINDDEPRQVEFVEETEIIDNKFNVNAFKYQLNNNETETFIDENDTKKYDTRFNNSIINDQASICNTNIPINKKAKKINLSIINKSNIIDTIKNVSSVGTIEELREKRSNITIIRQYINTFQKELINIYVNKATFEKKLYLLSIDALKIILEDIRITLNLSRNKTIFMNTIETGLRGFEKVSIYSGYQIDGLTDDLLKDPDFILDLSIIQCELDVSKYVNPKASAALKVLTCAYKKNKENEIKEKINNTLNNPSKIDKIKNLNKWFK